MKRKLLVVAILLVVLALSILRQSPPQGINMEAQGSTDASSPATRLEQPDAFGNFKADVDGRATTTKDQHRTAAELPLSSATGG